MGFMFRIIRSFSITVLCLCFSLLIGCNSDGFRSDIISDEELSKIEDHEVDLDNVFDDKHLTEEKTELGSSSFYSKTLPVDADNTDVPADIVSNGDDNAASENNVPGIIPGQIDNDPTDGSSQQYSVLSPNADVEKHDGDASDSKIEEKTIIYILNKNTKKFHFEWCKSSTEMKPKNKDIGTDRDSIIADGYVPCKRCNP